MLSAQVYDVMDATRSALEVAGVDSVQAVRQSGPLVCFGPDMAEKSAALKRFLLQNLYRHSQVVENTRTAQQVVRELFNAYMADPYRMPQAHTERFDQREESRPDCGKSAKPERVVADYIAGMTDRFATREHERMQGRVAFP